MNRKHPEFDDERGRRLRDERGRLGMTQSAIAALVGVRREMWARYENGSAEPGTIVAAKMEKAGVDVAYVLTGVRNNAQPQESALRTIESYGPSQPADATVLRLESPSIPAVSREEVCSMIIDVLHAKRRTLPSTAVWAIVDSIMALQRAGASVDKSTIDSQLRLVK